MKKISMIVLLVINVWITSAQNNAIFRGGPGDGINKISFAQLGNNIFTGGSNDGWAKTSFTQSTVNIFKGGAGDGWANTNFIQAPNNIFKGGGGDGWNNTSFLQAGNPIFKGGIGDGWNFKSFLQPGNNIFTGGIGDGWSSTYKPVGPLPVNFMFFNANKQAETALLNWKTSQEINSAYFDIERSMDAVNFIKIGTMNAAGNSALPIAYAFTDHQPENGFNYYRLKQVDINGHFEYSPSRVVKFSDTDAGIAKFYPNPTTGILNIELSSGMQREPKLLNISNVAGIMLRQSVIYNLNDKIIQIDLGQYSKGIYFIQVKTATANSTHRIILQ